MKLSLASTWKKPKRSVLSEHTKKKGQVIQYKENALINTKKHSAFLESDCYERPNIFLELASYHEVAQLTIGQFVIR